MNIKTKKKSTMQLWNG